jgi:hypothetical protein
MNELYNSQIFTKPQGIKLKQPNEHNYYVFVVLVVAVVVVDVVGCC